MDGARLAQLLTPDLATGPAYAAIAAGVRRLALDGRLPAGERVPSERDLAGALGVSRTTASAAYDVLREQGYLRSARGAGSHVALPAPAPTRPDVGEPEPEGVIDLTIASLPAPSCTLDAVAEASAALPRHLSTHGIHPYGLPELREALAARSTEAGLPTRPDQVMVTSGAVSAYNLVLGRCTRPGARVVVEQPTYAGVLDATRDRGRRPVPLPVTADGWEVSALREPRARGAALAVLTPGAQNPTGLVASEEQRRDVLAALRALPGAPVVVTDETIAELVLEGTTPPPLAALDDDVVTLGSLGKSFWSGLRVGWVRAAPGVLAPLAASRAGSDLATPVLEQLVCVALLRRGEEVLAERRAELRLRRDALLAALRAQLPDWTVRVPRAGLFLWAQLPGLSATAVAAHALDLGLRVTPGPRFTLDGSADGWLRLPLTVAAPSCATVVGLLAEAAQRAATRRPARSAPSRWTA